MDFDLLLKTFDAQRRYLESSIRSFSEIKGNAKYAADALILYWTDFYLLRYGVKEEEKRNEIVRHVLVHVLEENIERELGHDFAPVYVTTAGEKPRGFNLKPEVSAQIKETWIREPLIKACDYLLYPDSVYNYVDFKPPIQNERMTEEELLKWLSNDIPLFVEYGENIKLLLALN
ncbi:MAG TPA: hypothetical protein VFD05_02215 [Bacilli bacterium]|nr:hypothetical protein [Bacilli bacterium]